jgi:hypothetical protein
MTESKPLGYVIPVSAPDETEAEYYHRRFQEVAKELAAVRADYRRLMTRLLELLEEEAES